MNRFKKALAVGLVVSLIGSFASLASPSQGMAALGSNSKYQAWAYFTGEENEFGVRVYLENQWKQVWGYWYYFDETGRSLCNTWKEINGKWYYFDQWSIMQHDTTTPDGYYVGSDGAWIPGATESDAVKE